jgi:O-antigen/teichoic acid export membrane protein
MSLSTNTPSLKVRVLQAGGWTIAGYFLQQVIRFGSSLIMTRLLVPEMFGVMAIVYVVITGLALFSDVGLSQIVIQSQRGEDPEFLNTVWVVQIVRGALMWLTALLLSAALPLITQFKWLPADSVYADPLLPVVIAAYTSIALIGGFESTKMLLARRRLTLAFATKIEIISQVVAVAVMISWAALERSIWPLVGGGVIAAIVRVVLTHVMLPGPNNRWAWNASDFREIIVFGKWIFASSIFSFLVMNGDRLLLGGLVNAELLGLYSIAFLFANSLQGLIHYLMGIVAYPALSEVARQNPTRLRLTYYKFRMPFDAAMLTVAGGLFTFGSSLIHLLYDNRYAGAGPIMEVLALGMIAARYLLAGNCFYALGKPGINTLVSTIQLFAFYLLVPAAFSMYQFQGAVWAIALSPILTLPVIFYFKWKNQLLDLRKELLVLPLFVIGALVGKLFSMLVN